jgi:hypothetical protein
MWAIPIRTDRIPALQISGQAAADQTVTRVQGGRADFLLKTIPTLLQIRQSFPWASELVVLQLYFKVSLET